MSTTAAPKKPYTGGCHCGNIRYRAVLDTNPPKMSKCNCSICHKNGYIFTTVASESEFQLLSPASTTELGSYEFGNKTMHHMFCKTCGVSCFYKGHSEALFSEASRYGVNLLTLDPDQGLDLRKVKFQYWNGIDEEWDGTKDEPAHNGIW